MMLRLINEARADAGVPPVELIDDPTAQSHAQEILDHCFASHWGRDGLKPYMRHSIAGGYLDTAENVTSFYYCPRQTTGRSDGTMVREAMAGFMDSEGHRESP